MLYELIATATFGLEAVVRREIEDLGYKVISTEDGRVTFIGSEEAIVKSNLYLRSADRVYIKLGEFPALEFEDLYQGVLAIPFEEYIAFDGNFVTDAVSVKSKLHAVPSIQSVSEKAIINRLMEAYAVDKKTRLPKTGAKYKIRISIHKDMALISMDTSGAGLHKRGYRTSNVVAPIKETLAAAMVSLSFWKTGRLLVDPFCGSGTIAIEAAMIARGIAPGLSRKFNAEEWHIIEPKIWKEERKKAYAAIDLDTEVTIIGSDIDKKAVEAAEENAVNAGVDDCISFRVAPFAEMDESMEDDYGIIITNPPYGERIGDEKEIAKIYSEIDKFMTPRPTWSLYLITADGKFEQNAMGRKADRRRKLYNGKLQTTYYQYYGEKPKRK